ncbi:MAG TPA: AAA family ATPase [Ghiorsea sp.]|nr:AAA family ATPase [Ghiorsea sp.]
MSQLRAQLLKGLKELRLPTIRDSFEEEAMRAEAESLGYEHYLLELIQRECEERQNKRVERYLRESKIPPEKSLSQYEQERLPLRVRQKLRTLLSGDFLSRQENILAFGNPGSGKTHLLCALGQELIREGARVYFTTGALLVQELLLAKQELRLGRKIKHFAKFDAVIIDDIGYVQQNQAEMEVLFTFLSERYERGSVMLSSNLPFSQWDKIFKNPMVTAAAIDRLVHHSVILELNLPSYRMAVAKESLEGEPKE